MPTRFAMRSCQALLLMAFAFRSGTAVANGRFPRAERVIENPNDPDQLTLAATYGLVTTQDRGRNWYYVCEAAFAKTEVYTGDPLLDLAGDGTLLVGVQTTLNVSRNGACSWAATLGGGDAHVIDYSVVKPERNTVLAVLAYFENGRVAHSLFRSTDHAATWERIGDRLPVDIVYTVDVAPTDPLVVYVTGLENNAGKFLRSVDGGSTFTAFAIPHTSISEPPYIAAVHPRDPRRIFVRTDSWVSIDGTSAANDALLHSTDGGATWAEVFRNRAKMFGFALSPDGGTVLIGFGDPIDPGPQAVTGQLGVFKSATDVFSFERILPAHVGCLAWTNTGVYVCGSQRFDGFELAFAEAADIAPDAGCWRPLLRLGDIKSPPLCPADVAPICDEAWRAACATFGACKDAGPAPVGCIDRGGEPSLDGGLSDSGGGGRPAETSRSSEGCGCRMARSPTSAGPFALVAASLGSMLHRARKARRTR